MRTKDALLNLKNNNIDEDTRQFLIQKLEAKPPVLNEKYGSLRCPCCDIIIVATFHKYCHQCGQRIKGK